MAGTLFGLGLSPQFDANGDLARGALLYIYAANTSTPADTYSDFALTSAHAWPLAADAAGRLPAFWVDDGSFRAHLTTAAGVTIFDEPSITAIGASVTTESGGGGGGSGTPEFQTGDVLWVPVDTTRSGWVRANARTIGSAASSATERANADTEDLYAFLWDNFSDSLCPVSGGRGASAAADFAANKPIATLDMRGRAAWGLDTMGNSAASTLPLVTTAGFGAGAASFTLSTSQLPSHTHGPGTLGGTTSSNGAHTHTVDVGGNTESLSSGGQSASGTDDSTTSSNGAHTHTITLSTGVTGSTGSGSSIDNMPPYRAGTWYFKL